MTMGGALSELNNLLKADDIPIYYKPSIKAVMDTVVLSNLENPNRWIHVSERMPSEYEYVIVSVFDDNGDTPLKYTTVAWLCNGVWVSNNDILCDTAVAWMPLPKPYEPQESEDDR